MKDGRPDNLVEDIEYLERRARELFVAPTDVGQLKPPDSLAPGAFEAIRRGCTCDRLANDYGRGDSNGDTLGLPRRHIVNERCPLHGSPDPVCDRCQRPIVRAPGQLGRIPKHHDACRTPAEIAHTEYMRRWNERVREEKRRAKEGGHE